MRSNEEEQMYQETVQTLRLAYKMACMERDKAQAELAVLKGEKPMPIAKLCLKHSPLIQATVQEKDCEACRLEKENEKLKDEVRRLKEQNAPYKKTWE